MDRELYEPPNLPFSYPFKINIIYIERIHFRQYLIGIFEKDFSRIVIEVSNPTILPVVTYGAEWNTIIFIFFR